MINLLYERLAVLFYDCSVPSSHTYMASLSASGPVLSGLSCPTIHYFPFHSVEDYISKEDARHDVYRFDALPGYPWRLSNLYNNHAWDTAAQAYSRKRKH